MEIGEQTTQKQRQSQELKNFWDSKPNKIPNKTETRGTKKY